MDPNFDNRPIWLAKVSNLLNLGNWSLRFQLLYVVSNLLFR